MDWMMPCGGDVPVPETPTDDPFTPYAGIPSRDALYSVSLTYLIRNINLTSEQISFLAGRDDISQALKNYLTVNGTSQENMDFVQWAIDYLVGLPDTNLNEFSTRFLNSLPPYKVDSYIRNKYPKFSSTADGLVFFLATNPKVVAALSKYSGFSKNEIMQLATNGSGPNIKLSSESWTTVANGMYNAQISDNTIFLAEDNLRMFENNILDSKVKYSLAFSLMVTILHETVHYGRFRNGMPDSKTNPDFGTKFEELGFAFNVEFKFNQPVTYKMYFIP